MPDLFTIGYEKTTLDRVLDALAAAGVTDLVDIRAIPQSRKPGFSKTLLSASAEARGIRYTHLRGLGTPKAGREAARRGDDATLAAIFGAHMESDAAQADLAQARGIARGTAACLLCFERDHTHCHRLLVGRLVCEITGQTMRHLEAALPESREPRGAWSE